MDTLSKTIKLGVIILALRLLAQLKLPQLRIIAGVAALLGVSRKAGYEATERILRVIERPDGPREDEDLRSEVIRLRVRNQVLTYERDHPGVRFAKRRKHLPAEAKSLCVRILRDFKEKLPKSEIAGLLEVPLSSLERWDKEARDDCTFPEKPDARGKHRHRTPEDEDRVVEAYKRLEQSTEKEKSKKSATLEEFTQHFNSLHPQNTLDRKTITRILQKHGLAKIGVRNLPPRYHGKMEIHFPCAQAAVDGKKCKVVFTAGERETIELTKEVAIDLATTTILGDVLEREENAEGVQRVVIRARAECERLLAVLSDNGSANRANETQQVVKRESEVGPIFSFPYHPKTNGHIEGMFGQFVRIAGTVEIDDSSRETIARSVLEVVWRTFIYFHNYSPRKRLGGLSPIEYLRNYTPLPEEVERARKRLRERRKRSEALREEHPRLKDESFRKLVETIITEHRLPAEFDDAINSLLPFDRAVIESSSSAFFTQSQRDGFDERKRTFAYFMGIVRKKQKSIDEARRQSHHGDLNSRRILDQQDAQQRKIEKEKTEEKRNFRERPEDVILYYSKRLLSTNLRWMRRTSLEKIRKAMKALLRLGRATKRHIEQLALTIRSWAEYPEELKEEMARLLRIEYEIASGGG
jgi:transposase InsO family protein